MSNTADKDLSIAKAFVEEMKTASIDTGIEFHFMRFLMLVAVREGHDEMIARIRFRLDYWPRSLPEHHRELALELIASLERKKQEIEQAAARAKAKEEEEFNRLVPYPDDPHERF